MKKERLTTKISKNTKYKIFLFVGFVPFVVILFTISGVCVSHFTWKFLGR